MHSEITATVTKVLLKKYGKLIIRDNYFSMLYFIDVIMFFSACILTGYILQLVILSSKNDFVFPPEDYIALQNTDGCNK